MIKMKEIIKAYNTGLDNGNKKGHLTPSPETRERLIRLETNYNNMSEKLEELKIENQTEHKDIKKMISDLTDKLDKTLETKAGKWVESAMVWFLVAVSTGILGIIGTLIFQAIVHFN
jgi:predicted nuclease with TOPRIM domain